MVGIVFICCKFHKPRKKKYSDIIFSLFLRSKVKVSNESPVMTSYLKFTVTVCLSGTIFKMSALLIICSLS